MLKESFGLLPESEWIEAAADRVLEQGYRTADIAEPGSQSVGCSKMVELIRGEMTDSLLHAERYGWGV
jgi:3-isopropylmalate dehydrogenase